MRRGDSFPEDQAEVTYSDIFEEQLEALPAETAKQVLGDIVRLCANPGGKHPLRARLAGFNTVEVAGREMRCVYRATPPNDTNATGLIEVLCIGKRRNNEVYDAAQALLDANLITGRELTQIWIAFDAVGVAAERYGLDGWDYRPTPPNEGLVLSAVAAGLVDETTARLLSESELVEVLKSATEPDPLQVALERQRRLGPRLAPDQLPARATARCGKWMPNARTNCVRRKGHPGPCRRSP